MGRRAALFLASAVAVAALALVASPDPPVGYTVRAAGHQLGLLWGTVPLAAYTPADDHARENLARIPEIGRFAVQRLGLNVGGAYHRVQPRRTEPIWNVSACPPLALTPERFWFPIVGSVPYLGYFDRADADASADRLRARGLEVWVRPAGTYSTLGWFNDPLLPPMLDWSEHRLAATLIHEWVHATVWVPGSVGFDESLASFVGDQAAVDWLVSRYGADAEPVRSARDEAFDQDRFHEVVEELTAELLAVYESADADPVRLARKADLFASVPARVAAAGLRDPDRYRAAADPAGWNNARVAQLRTYHRGYRAFQALLDRSGGDLRGLLDQIRALPPGDPWAALAAASGVSDDDVTDF